MRSIAAGFTILSFTACSVLPVSEELQKSIVRSAKDQFFSQKDHWDDGAVSWKKLQDPSLDRYLTRIGEKVRKESQVIPGLQYLVIDTPIVQAVTDSDNSTIFVTLGMLNTIQNEAELACLLGHEIHHQEQFIRKFKNEKTESFSQDIYDKVSPEPIHGFGLRQDLEDISYANYSKAIETDADEQGSFLCGKAGYQASALSSLQERIAATIQDGIFTKLKNLKGSHDELKDRADHLHKWLKKQAVTENQGNLNSSEYAAAFHKLRPSSLTATQKFTLQTLSRIGKNIELLSSSGKKVTALDFSKLSSQLSKIVQNEKISSKELFNLSVSHFSGDHFMQERVVNPFDRYGNYHNQVVAQVLSILEGIGRIAIGFTPLGPVIDFHDLVTGKDFFTGEKLSPWERALSAVGLAVGQGQTLRDFALGLREAKAFVLEEKIIRQGESLVEGIKSSPTLNKIYKAENFKSSDFYVRPNGEIIPAKGFRYIGTV